MSCVQCGAKMTNDGFEMVCCYLYSCGMCDWTWLPPIMCDWHAELSEEEE